MVTEPEIQILDEIDEECRKHGLPPLSRIVRDVPGRANATDEECEEVFTRVARGDYAVIGIENGSVH